MTNENPVDYLIRRCGMTRIAFTREYGFGENHLLLVAQGRKESIGDRLYTALHHAATTRGINLGIELQNTYGHSHLADAWLAWRTEQRAKADLPLSVRSGLGSPMARLVRHFGSVSATAKALRVRDINVRRYMDTDRMPEPIFDALCETSWGRNGAEALKEAQIRYFKDKGRKR